MNAQINIDEILTAISNVKEDSLKTTIELSTLEAVGDGSSYTMIADKTANLKELGLTVVLLYTFGVENAEEKQDIKMVSTGIDPNTENTAVKIEATNEDLEIIYDGEAYTCDELSELHEFKQLILNSELNDFNDNTANKILAQLP